MGARFASENLADCKIVADDSNAAFGQKVTSGITPTSNQVVPRPGIDTDARWEFAKTKGWIFGYKIHLACSTGRLVVPLSADVSRANVHDTQMYRGVIESLPDTVHDMWQQMPDTISQAAG